MRRPHLYFGALAAYFVLRAVLNSMPLIGICAPLLIPARTRRIGAAVMLAIAAWRLAGIPFVAANHHYLEAWLLALVALVPADRPDALRRAVRTLAAILILFTGVQKVAHGYYPRGDYFAVMYATPSKFTDALLPLVSERDREEAAAFRDAYERHLTAGVPGVLDRAPPRPPLVRILSVLACWATLAAEIALPLLLLVRRTRRAAALALALFFVGVEAAAHEWVFGLLVAFLLWPSLEGEGDEHEHENARRPWLRLPGVTAYFSLFIIWPFLHFGATQVLDLNPWKLAGWAMYSVPARFGDVRIETFTPGDAAWSRWKPRGGAETQAVERRDFLLRSAPFATDAARELAGKAIDDPTLPRRPAVARVRSLRMEYDRATDRFHLVERTWFWWAGS